jgi:hypothetical protein
MKVKITFPQIVFESKEVELSDGEFDAVQDLCFHDQVDFIWNNMTEDEKDWCPMGKKGLKDALDLDYCRKPRITSLG